MMGWCLEIAVTVAIADADATLGRVCSSSSWTSFTFPTIRGRRAGSHPVLALGNFDGVHRGHRKILDRVRRVASERGATSVVMTFDPHPPRVVRPDKAPPLLMTKAQKLEAIADAGVQGAAIVRFTPRAVALGSGDVRAHRARRLAARRRRSGSARTFCSATIAPATSRCCARSARRYGFKAEKIDPVRYKDFVVSSTRIRRLVSEGARGRSGRAARPPVLHRRHGRARRPARPDASGFRPRTCAPRTSCCRRTASTRRRRRSTAIVHAVGDQHRRRGRPSTRRAAPTIETHIFDLDRDLYGAPIRVGFVQRLRDERAFESLDLLRAQIAADCRRARVLFDRLSL